MPIIFSSVKKLWKYVCDFPSTMPLSGFDFYELEKAFMRESTILTLEECVGKTFQYVNFWLGAHQRPRASILLRGHELVNRILNLPSYISWSIDQQGLSKWQQLLGPFMISFCMLPLLSFSVSFWSIPKTEGPFILFSIKGHFFWTKSQLLKWFLVKTREPCRANFIKNRLNSKQLWLSNALLCVAILTIFISDLNRAQGFIGQIYKLRHLWCVPRSAFMSIGRENRAENAYAARFLSSTN